MTPQSDTVESGLQPCPFCGGDAERIDIPAEEGDPNAGGSLIGCTRCGASSPVHFDRKENLYSGWNERASALHDDLVAALRLARVHLQHEFDWLECFEGTEGENALIAKASLAKIDAALAGAGAP